MFTLQNKRKCVQYNNFERYARLFADDESNLKSKWMRVDGARLRNVVGVPDLICENDNGKRKTTFWRTEIVNNIENCVILILLLVHII